MNKMIFWLTWVNALLVGAIYSKFFDSPAWVSIGLSFIISLSYAFGLIIDDKEKKK